MTMMDTGISEAASKKRGRPKAWSEAAMAVSRFCVPDVKTTRHLQNVAYRQLAMGYLANDPAFAWLCDSERMTAGDAAWRPGILAELGRFLEEETIKAYAARICELKPKTKDAIAMLRRARTGKASAPDTLDLTNKIIGLINQYAADRPGMTKDQILDAIATARDAVERSDL
jgi:hypothetical protein